jgi:RND family efflux transporter MFP subunit
MSWTTVALLAGLAAPVGAETPAGEGLASVEVQSFAAPGRVPFDGVVEAARRTEMAAQVAGAVVEIRVKPGDAVRPGQVLVRLDARAAEQQAAAGEAQAQSARAALEVARREYDRQQQLFQKGYISQSAYERAQAQLEAAQAQVDAQVAQAGAARTQSGFYSVTAPYGGIVAEVPAVLGDMALPGRSLVTIYDPLSLRVTARVPQTAVHGAIAPADAAVEIPGLSSAPATTGPARVQVLPTVDPATHTVEVRLDLAKEAQGAAPGMFARAWLPAVSPGVSARLFVPQRCIVRRAELTALYVVDAQGRAQLRQVRLGETSGEQVEVLAGVSAQERVALDPQAAARGR